MGITMKKLFKANVTFTFKGELQINAKDRQQAIEYLEKHFGTTLGQIQTTLDDEDIDWEFPVHPDKKITNVHLA